MLDRYYPGSVMPLLFLKSNYLAFITRLVRLKSFALTRTK
jgi:hypothetical protein